MKRLNSYRKLQSAIGYLQWRYAKAPNWHQLLKKVSNHPASKEIYANEFSWIKDCSNELIKSCIKAEKKYHNLYFKRMATTQTYFMNAIQEISPEINTKYKKDLHEVYGKHEYFIKYPQSGYPIIMRRYINQCKTDEHTQHVVVDLNYIVSSNKDVKLGPLKISSCENFVACCISGNQENSYTLYILKISNDNSILLHSIDNVNRLEWLDNSNDLIYATQNQYNRSNKLWKYNIINKSSVVLLEEDDDRFVINLSKTKDDAFVVVNIDSRLSSDVYIVSSYENNLFDISQFSQIHSRQKNSECYVDHFQKCFLKMVIDQHHGEFVIRMKSSDVAACDEEWEDYFIPFLYKEKLFMHDFEVMKSSVVAYGSVNLHPTVTVINAQSEVIQHIELHNEPFALIPLPNKSLLEDFLSLSISSPVIPLQTFRVDLINGNYKNNEICSYSIGKFVYQIKYATSKDGTVIPVSVYHQSNIKDLSTAPLLMVVYGCYGALADLQFTELNSVLLKHGWIVAFCHARGGSDLGRKWWKAATMENKIKTFEDLEATLNLLHSMDFSKPKLTALKGISAGGLAVAALCNRQPWLTRAAILKVPFIDILSSMLDNDVPLTGLDLLEFGDPRNDRIIYEAIKAYCPYINLTCTKDFPSIYMSLSLDDYIVPSWIPLKWLAKCRHLILEDNTVSLKCNVVARIDDKGGHFHNSLLKDAQELVFLHHELGIEYHELQANIS